MSPRKPPRNLDDHPLWQHVIKDVKPLDVSDRLQPEKPSAIVNPNQAIKRLERKSSVGDMFGMAPSALPEAPELDRRTRRRISRHGNAIDQVIDLHGLSKDKAYTLLAKTLPIAQRSGHLIVLIITGKGGKRYTQTGQEPASSRKRADFALHEGILRGALSEWLNSSTLRPYIAGFQQASTHHGGAGAFYVRLKKSR